MTDSRVRQKQRSKNRPPDSIFNYGRQISRFTVSDDRNESDVKEKPNSAGLQDIYTINESEDVGMTTTTRDNIVAGGIALGSVFFLVWAIPNFTPAYPGYGVSSRLLPNVVISLILALSVLSLVTNILFHYRTKSSVTTEERRAEKEKDEIRPEDQVHLWHLAIFMIPCILLFPALRWVGFIPGAILFMMVMQYFCGQRNPLINVIVAICTTGVIYMAMMYGLKVPMP